MLRARVPTINQTMWGIQKKFIYTRESHYFSRDQKLFLQLKEDMFYIKFEILI